MNSFSKVLFLDVDGVLNASGQTKERFHGLLGICPVMMHRLHRILLATDCSVVVSSTWRKHPAHMEHLKECMGPVAAARIVGTTPGLDEQRPSGLWTGQSRGNEIKAWLDTHPEVKRFVILDDDFDLGGLLPHHVATNTFEGLTDEQAAETIRRLNAV